MSGSFASSELFFSLKLNQCWRAGTGPFYREPEPVKTLKHSGAERRGQGVGSQAILEGAGAGTGKKKVSRSQQTVKNGAGSPKLL